MCMTCSANSPGHPSRADEAWYGQNVSCALSDLLISMSSGCLQAYGGVLLGYSCVVLWILGNVHGVYCVYV